MEFTFGSVCSGIEAASVAWEPLGWRGAWFAEIEPFPSSVLAYRFPNTPNLGDMTTIAARVRAGEVDAPDGLVGGTPCQAFSVAGLRAGLSDPRGALTLAYVDLANAIDATRLLRGKPPAVIVWENVPGVLSSKDNAFGCFLAGLAGESCELEPPGRPEPGKSGRNWRWDKKAKRHIPAWSNAGCVFGPQRTIAWRVLDAQYFGVAQRRRRVFVVASARDGFNPAEVLFEFEGVRRDTPPRREAGQGFTHDVAPSLTRSGRGVERPGETRGQDPMVAVPVAFGGNNTGGPIDVATARNACASACASGRMDFESETFLVQPCVTGDITHSLRADGADGADGADASEDGTGRGTPIVPVIARASDADLMRLAHAIAFPANMSGTQYANATEDQSPALGAKNPTAVAFTASEMANSYAWERDIHPTITAQQPSETSNIQTGVRIGMQVRRLTPTECERLQAFPDGWTNIPKRVIREKLPPGAGPCAKQTVRATIVGLNGNHFEATNHVLVPQATCPRADMPTGVGYELCRDVCKQPAHAEVNAIKLAGVAARGATLYVEGHTYACSPCKDGAAAAGIAAIVFGKPHGTAADGPRYKSLGNSMCVYNMRWIGKRIAAAISSAA